MQIGEIREIGKVLINYFVGEFSSLNVILMKIQTQIEVVGKSNIEFP
jgi:hypothetical protein